ncbi:hypothetical protein QCA50_009105 [Cerrena zonata]|uniref:Uncharacterized protein n=1 Tax=Cerrena zonata TaxID=2478898 RepID=A0AAW0GE58_9APHY
MESQRASLSSETGSAMNFETLCDTASRRALAYEHQMKDLDARLSSDLSNARAIDTILRELIQGLKNTQRRSSLALTTAVPNTSTSLSEDLRVLNELEDDLPRVRTQVKDIRNIYDRGKGKAKDLVASLEWLNTPIPLRLRAIIFTSDAPVNKRWKVLFRTLFALIFLACIWISWITLRGAIRAHKQRLVWGERLMS